MKRIAVLGLLILVIGGLFTSVAAQQATEEPTPPIPLSHRPIPKQPFALAALQTFLQQTNETCQLPCIWGIQPGVTPVAALSGLLNRGVGFEQTPNFIFSPVALDIQDLIDIFPSDKNGLITALYVDIYHPSTWLPLNSLELSRLLATMHSIPAVYLQIVFSEVGPWIYVKFIYDEEVYAQYAYELNLPDDLTQKVPLLLCPTLDLNRYISMSLGNPNPTPFSEAYSPSNMVDTDHVWTVEHMTGLTNEQFVQQIINHPDECVKLPSYPELSQAGYQF